MLINKKDVFSRQSFIMLPTRRQWTMLAQCVAWLQKGSITYIIRKDYENQRTVYIPEERNS